jgi:hypothetical protein
VGPAIEAAGLAYRPPYSMRHTFVAFSIAANIRTFLIARQLGTSVEQIEKTYGHLLPDAAEFTRGQLDAFDAARTRRRRKTRAFCRLAATDSAVRNPGYRREKAL